MFSSNKNPSQKLGFFCFLFDVHNVVGLGRSPCYMICWQTDTAESSNYFWLTFLRILLIKADINLERKIFFEFEARNQITDFNKE